METCILCEHRDRTRQKGVKSLVDVLDANFVAFYQREWIEIMEKRN